MVRGSLRENADIGRSTWFQVGGPAERLFKPEDAEDLADFMREKPANMPITVIGVGSNLLVRDGGVKGCVVRLGRGFTQMSVIGGQLAVGAGCLDVNVAQFAAQNGIAGLEFLSGIPGTIGGAVVMNAGAYGSDVSQVLAHAEIVDSEGRIRSLSNEELGFTYRHSSLPEGAIVVSAMFQGTPDAPETIAARMLEIQASREATQPVRSKTGGSTFKNPPGQKAWQLIDAAGCRGLKRGAAQVSELHCNFLINTGGATAAEIEGLGEEVRARVKAHSGINLEWEIQRIGEA